MSESNQIIFRFAQKVLKLKTCVRKFLFFSIFQLDHLEIKQVTVPYVDHVSGVLLKTENTVQAHCSSHPTIEAVVMLL